ncbi:hypothetical protein HII31_05747 [Pseudocercospora fuligena]|uniref:Coenzyme Q-binding protein COQ10 START domain-containing protein n=1 Tax=Pseudocercospora fuligena TaxID=685502 RepID=A0A8H6RMQ3_9PEZI|nr:hypothetical protein HII31_05747 [Pseudocercospora fuligena]
MAPGAAYTDHQFRSNAHTGPRATPTIPKGGVFSVYAEITIPTPPQYPYEALLDIRTWREWNSFNPDVIITKHSNPHSRDIRMEQGCFMTVSYQITPDVRKETKSVCRHMEPLKHKDDGKESHSMGGNVTRIRWTSDNANLLTPGFVLKTERVNEIEETSDGHCKYRTWLTFDGFSAKTMKKKYEKALVARLPEFCEDLKERSMKLYQDQPDPRKMSVSMPRKSMQQTRSSVQIPRPSMQKPEGEQLQHFQTSAPTR